MSLDIQPLLDDEGTHIGFVAIENDVTERRRAAAALADATERTECALDGGKLAIWDWDLINNELEFDRRWYDIVRRDPHTSSAAADSGWGLCIRGSCAFQPSCGRLHQRCCACLRNGVSLC